MSNAPIFPIGHFYSPIVDVEDVATREVLWKPRRELTGVDFNESFQRTLLQTVFTEWMLKFDYPVNREDTDEGCFYLSNDQFTWLDARSLFAFMCAWRPARVVEVGSGYSSTIMLDVRNRFLDGKTHITCIEPYPRPVLREAIKRGGATLVEAKVQDVDFAVFDALEAGDILFIDSSHVAKTGSDCNFLYFEVMPRLKPGVRIHIHDIFLPLEYPRHWVVDENRSWNEQYIVHAMLMYTQGYRILFGSSYAANFLAEDALLAVAPNPTLAVGGGSLWLEKLI